MSENSSLRSVDNALEVLELFQSTPSLRVLDVARALGVANSTAHRLLNALVARGFVAQDEGSRRYVAGEALLRISRAAAMHQQLRTLARPTLEEIAKATGETVHLGVREGTNVRYVDAVESARAVRVAGRTGMTLEAHCTSTGKVLLAALPDDALRRMYATETLTPLTEHSIDNVSALLVDLDRCRRAGYAMNSGESEDDVVSVAVALTDAAGTTIAAVSCAAPRHRLPPKSARAIAATMRDIIDMKFVRSGPTPSW